MGNWLDDWHWFQAAGNPAGESNSPSPPASPDNKHYKLHEISRQHPISSPFNEICFRVEDRVPISPDPLTNLYNHQAMQIDALKEILSHVPTGKYAVQLKAFNPAFHTQYISTKFFTNVSPDMLLSRIEAAINSDDDVVWEECQFILKYLKV